MKPIANENINLCFFIGAQYTLLHEANCCNAVGDDAGRQSEGNRSAVSL